MEKIKEILWRYDPINICFNDLSLINEYEPEVKPIIEAFNTSKNLNDFNLRVYDIFVKFFNKKIVGNILKYKLISKEIYSYLLKKKIKKEEILDKIIILNKRLQNIKFDEIPSNDILEELFGLLSLIEPYIESQVRKIKLPDFEIDKEIVNQYLRELNKLLSKSSLYKKDKKLYKRSILAKQILNLLNKF